MEGQVLQKKVLRSVKDFMVSDLFSNDGIKNGDRFRVEGHDEYDRALVTCEIFLVEDSPDGKLRSMVYSIDGRSVDGHIPEHVYEGVHRTLDCKHPKESREYHKLLEGVLV